MKDIALKVLDVSVDGKTILVTDKDGHPRYEPNRYGADVGTHEVNLVYLKQYHYVAGSVPQGLTIMKNGKPNPREWRRLSQWIDLVGRR